jgi:hypothetical protein
MGQEEEYLLLKASILLFGSAPFRADFHRRASRTGEVSGHLPVPIPPILVAILKEHIREIAGKNSELASPSACAAPATGRVANRAIEDTLGGDA